MNPVHVGQAKNIKNVVEVYKKIIREIKVTKKTKLRAISFLDLIKL